VDYELLELEIRIGHYTAQGTRHKKHKTNFSALNLIP